MPTVDASVMRSANKRTVLGLLYHKKTSSRVDISRTTGLNPATVSSLVDELIHEQYVEEVGTGPSSGGRKPIIIRFNADTGYVIGVDVQITHLSTVLINANREVIFERRMDIPPAAQPLHRDDLTDLIEREVVAAKRRCPPSPHGLMGVGVGLPGLVDHHQGRALLLPNLGIVDWDISRALAQRETLPIFVDNDANCGAWSEYLTSGTANLLFINSGVGLGVGTVINGQLYRGAHGIAGEAGHHAISPTGLDCLCGNIGCWEQFASERGLARTLRDQGIVTPFPLPADFIHRAIEEAQHGNSVYLEAFDDLARHLATGLINLLNLLNPQTIYLGGTVAEAQSLLLPLIHEQIRSRALLNNQEVVIHPSSPTSVALGAAGLALARSIDWLPTGV